MHQLMVFIIWIKATKLDDKSKSDDFEKTLSELDDKPKKKKKIFHNIRNYLMEL